MSFAWWEGFLLRREFAACVVYVEIATGENGMVFRQLFQLVRMGSGIDAKTIVEIAIGENGMV